VLALLAVVVMFSMFALQRRQALVLAGVALLMLATVMRAMTLADPFRYRVEVEAVHLGVTALVLIGVTLLSLRMARLRQRLRDQRTALARALEKLSEIATRDELTGLPNRRAMGELLLTETARHARLKAPLSLALLDIDHFKQINDRLGHAAGDEVLRGFAQRIEAELRGADVMARWGGEEFLLLLPGVSLAQAQKIAERLRTRVASHDMEVAGHITISLGVAHWGADATSIAAVLKEADKALYDAKSQGRNCVVVALG